MKDLITKEHRAMLFKDECGDEFLLIKGGEIFENGETTLKAHIYSVNSAVIFRKKVPFLNKDATSDPLWVFTFEKRNLGLAIEALGFKRRPRSDSKFMKNIEKNLCHKVIPYKPEVLK